MELSVGTDPEVDDGGSQQDPDTLHQISHHVDESRLHAGVGVAVTVAAVLMLFVPLRTAGTAVTVAMRGTRLMEDQGHPTNNKVQTRVYHTQNNPSLDLPAPRTHRMLTPTAQPEVMSMIGLLML